MNFQAQKSTQSQANMIPLWCLFPMLRFLNPGELFQAAMVDFDLPGTQGIFRRLCNGHLPVTGGPVFSVAIFANCPEYLDPAISPKMDLSAMSGDMNRLNLAIALSIGVNLTVFWQAAEPGPLQAAQQLQILQTGVPAIEGHQFRLESTLLRLTQHCPKMVIVVKPSFCLL